MVNKANSEGGLIEGSTANVPSTTGGNRISVALPDHQKIDDYRDRNDQSVAATEANKTSVVSANTESREQPKE